MIQAAEGPVLLKRGHLAVLAKNPLTFADDLLGVRADAYGELVSRRVAGFLREEHIQEYLSCPLQHLLTVTDLVRLPEELQHTIDADHPGSLYHLTSDASASATLWGFSTAC